MPVRSVQTTAGAGTLSWVPLNVHEDHAPVHIHINSTNAGSVEYTLDNVLDADVSALAITKFTFAAATAATLDHPATAVRLVVSSGAATMRVLQAGV
jgi:hypothetical protein